MEEIKIKGIVFNSRDYKEKDKLVEIFSLEQGKIFASLKGCKMPTSKLKFAYQPFCFAEFILHKTGENYVITNANLIESFFDITTNTVSYINGSLILEIANNCCYGEENNSIIFVNLLKSLKTICYLEVNSSTVLIKFCLEMLANLGYKLSFKNCSSCKLPISYEKFLCLDSGEFLCENCATLNSVKISNAGFSSLRIINETDYDRLGSLKISENILKELSIILCENLENRFGKALKGKSFLLV